MTARAAAVAVALVAFAAAGAGSGAAAPDSGSRPDFRVLVYFEADSFHYSVGSAPAAVAAIEALGERHSFGVASRQNPIVFRSEVLRHYDAIVFASPDGEVLDEAQQAAFERFVGRGGGFVGIHAATTAEASWPFYVELVGALFVSHPPIQPAALVVEDRDHPSTARLPRHWVRSDEWYDFDRDPGPDVHVLVSADESSYSGGTMGASHPITWCQRYAGGRSWYTAMGHPPEAYAEPALRRHLLGAIRWAAGDEPGDCRA